MSDHSFFTNYHFVLVSSQIRFIEIPNIEPPCFLIASSLEKLCCLVTSVVSNSSRPQRRQPTRLPCPRDSPGKNAGVGCHVLLQCMKVKSESEVTQSCPTLSDPMELQPTSLLRPWDFPGKGSGVGCHCLLQHMKVKSESEVDQSCLTLSDPWTAAYQAPLSVGFSRQEYWSGVQLPSLIYIQLNHFAVK